MHAKRLIVLLLLLAIFDGMATENGMKIDRRALVTRNNVVVTHPDTMATLSVGNGEFAFTTDITGLQTFYREYENGVTLGTQSNWGWHTNPNTENYQLSECTRYVDYKGRKVPYLVQYGGNGRDARSANYFRENPHRLQLGIIRLKLKKADGSEVKISDIQSPRHQLNMWEGRISSEFLVEGNPVKVELFCHQQKDLVSARVSSPLVKSGRLAIEWIFPFAAPLHTHSGYDFLSPDKHKSELKKIDSRSATILRTLDNDHYAVNLSWNQGANLAETDRHKFVLSSVSGNSLEFSCHFSPENGSSVNPAFAETEKNNVEGWKKFWETGGIVDFSSCTDPRAPELERRVVLSQYLTRIQSSGSLPPQETGLVFNSWFGKFHLEMHWWHSAHFANWNHPEYLVRQLDWYRTIYEKSLETAATQGFKGVRWPKMVGPEGQNSPSAVGSFLIWQQPHLIYMVEQLYQSNPSRDVLNKYKELVFATADFMADFAVPDALGNSFHLMPPLIPAQEHWNKDTATDPPFELSYWHWGLVIAQEWRKRLKMPVNGKWEMVAANLASPVKIDGLYPGVANGTESYTNPLDMRDHPSVLGALGVLPAWEKIDPEIMRNTLKVVMQKWNWPQTWGWDYPMVAMCAARLNEPQIALDALLMNVQKNTYLKNGHNYQGPRLKIYLPGNGGLLKAIALMCAGWQGSTSANPGFPKDGTWNVKWEGLVKDF